MKLPILASASPVNVNRWERAACIATGTAMALLGYRRGGVKSIMPVLSGGALIFRGVTGHCAVYDKVGINTAGPEGRDEHPLSYQEGVRFMASITINRRRDDVFDYWRELKNLPNFMWHVHKVTETGRKTSHWELKHPIGRHLQWDAKIINEIQDELIAWESLPGADIDSAGSVTFKDASYDRGTEVRLNMTYDAPGGKLGTTIARFLGHDPADAAQADLDRLKTLLEQNAEPAVQSRKRQLTTT